MGDPQPAFPSHEMLEDCLQAVHRIQSQGRTVEVADVAAFARITAVEADHALRELQGRGLLQPDSASGPGLTEEGRRQALGVLRRHRLSERLFTDVLGLPWDRAHEEAMRLEHALTPRSEARLADLLDHPETCPHGGPIPAADGQLAPVPTTSLDRVPAGHRVWIQQIMEEEPDLLRYLASLGLLPRVELTVEEVAPFGGPLLVQIGDARYALGRDVAARILVREEPGTPEPRPKRWRRRAGWDPRSPGLRHGTSEGRG